MLPLGPEKLVEAESDWDRYQELLSTLKERLGVPENRAHLHGVLIPKSYGIKGELEKSVSDQSPMFCFHSTEVNRSLVVVRWNLADGNVSRFEGAEYFEGSWKKNEENLHFPRHGGSLLVVRIEGKTDSVTASWHAADYSESWLYLLIKNWPVKSRNTLFERTIAGDMTWVRSIKMACQAGRLFGESD